MYQIKGLTKDQLRRVIEREMREHRIALPSGSRLEILVLEEGHLGRSDWRAQLVAASGLKVGLPPAAEYAFAKITARLRQRCYVKELD
jgi:hypothetical protein